MDKTYLKNLIDFLEKEYYLTAQFKEIGYGVQFYVSKNGSKDLIRVYQNNKGKITLDPSQIKTPTLREYLADFSPASTETKTAVLLAPPLIGTDEAGKGDFFAPLCVAGVYADERQYRKLITCGVRDSKQLTDEKILALAKEVQNICPVYSVIAISNQRFNELYTKTPNMNALLGWAMRKRSKTSVKKYHATVFWWIDLETNDGFKCILTKRTCILCLKQKRNAMPRLRPQAFWRAKP
jgi:ribonuclease HIII